MPTHASAPTPLLTSADVAIWLATSEQALAQLRFRSEGPSYVKLGRSVRYRSADVEAYVERHLNIVGGL